MTSLFDISVAAQATHPTTTQEAVEPVLTGSAEWLIASVFAIGLGVLAVWIIHRLLHARSLSLRGAPGRANRLGWVHVGVIVLWMALSVAPAVLIERPAEAPQMAFGGVIVNYVINLGVLAVTLAVAHKVFRRGIAQGLGLTPRHWVADTARGVTAVLGVYPVCVGLLVLGRYLLPEHLQAPHQLLVLLGEDAPAAQRLLMVLLAFSLVPVVEEVLYRGLLQTALRRVLGGPWRGIIAASVLFALAHGGVVGLEAMLPLFVLAVVMGYNYERTGRLWASIVIHMVFNGVNLAAALLAGG